MSYAVDLHEGSKYFGRRASSTSVGDVVKPLETFSAPRWVTVPHMVAICVMRRTTGMKNLISPAAA